jgi:hypothetical protein
VRAIVEQFERCSRQIALVLGPAVMPLKEISGDIAHVERPAFGETAGYRQRQLGIVGNFPRFKTQPATTNEISYAARIVFGDPIS